MPETLTWVYGTLRKSLTSTNISACSCIIRKNSNDFVGMAYVKGAVRKDAGGCWDHCLLPPHYEQVIIFLLLLCRPGLGPRLWVPGCLCPASLIYSSLKCPFPVSIIFQSAIFNSFTFARWYQRWLYEALSLEHSGSLSPWMGGKSSLLAAIRVKAENGSSSKKAEAVKNDNIVKSVDVRTNKYSFHLPTKMSSVK